MLASIVYPERNRGKIEVFDYFKRVKKFLLSHYSIILLLKFFNEIFIPNNLDETNFLFLSFFLKIAHNSLVKSPRGDIAYRTIILRLSPISNLTDRD